MSRSTGPALLARSRPVGLGDTESVTAGTQQREPAGRPPAPPLAAAELDRLRGAVAEALGNFLDRQRETLASMDPRLVPVVDEVRAVAEGGKRLRPAFAYWGWRGAGGDDRPEIITAVAALEWVQACALIHDDVMDGSDTRRGRPSVHRQFASRHAQGGWTGSAARFGDAVAVLLGDMCLVWAGQLLRESAAAVPGITPPVLAAALTVYDEMCAEVMAGQYLDVLAQAQGGADRLDPVGEALRVARFKSAKYTVERPLHLGAALAGAGPELAAAYTAYGLPVGEAFQLRDDVLGVFGDPAVTGKPAGDDLREGKRTVLVGLTLQRANPAQAGAVRRLLGDPRLDAEGVATLRGVITDTGALAATEQLIDELAAQAAKAVTGGEVAEPARDVLANLIVAATARAT